MVTLDGLDNFVILQGQILSPPGNQWKSAVRPRVAKSYFETYKTYDRMQKFRTWHLKILRSRDFVAPWPRKIGKTRLIFYYNGQLLVLVLL